jgi:ribosomal protein S18 acetylase RimI-like enzyme
MDISLRPANREDYDLLWEMHCTTMRASIEPIWGWDEERQRQLFAERFSEDRLQVVEADGVAIGTLSVQWSADCLSLERISIAADYQNRGIGTKLIRDLLEESEKHGVPVELHVLRGNRARRLYERLGFIVIAETEERIFMRRLPVTKI